MQPTREGVLVCLSVREARGLVQHDVVLGVPPLERRPHFRVWPGLLPVPAAGPGSVQVGVGVNLQVVPIVLQVSPVKPRYENGAVVFGELCAGKPV